LNDDPQPQVLRGALGSVMLSDLIQPLHVISAKKNEPEFMLQWRLKAFHTIRCNQQILG
jgi:hypothetical protein